MTLERSHITLGIHCGYSHDSGVALMRDGQILACIGEERLSRVKKDPAFPFKAIERLPALTGIPFSLIDTGCP